MPEENTPVSVAATNHGGH